MKDRDDFLSEAAILAQFNDSHVISVEGVILKGMWKVVMHLGQGFQKIHSLCNNKYNQKLPPIYVMTKWMANNYFLS